MTLNTIRVTILGLMLLPVVGTTSSDVRAQIDSVRLLTTNSMGSHISIVDPATGDVEQFEVGPAPWGIALTDDGRRSSPWPRPWQYLISNRNR